MNSILRATVLSAFIAGIAGAQAAPQPQPPRIITSGEAEVRVTPDRATIQVGVETRGATAATAGAQNARIQKAILDTLKAMGIGADQLTTQNYSVNPEMQYPPSGGPGKVTGYVVSNVVRVELKQIEQVGPIVDAALAKGANRINSIQFSSSTATEARRTAMADAVRDARADAEVLARAAGGTLGQVIEITSNAPPIRPLFADMAMRGVAKAAAPTPIEPGEQVISANVSVIWQFVPGSGR
jgi:uncharacterized protein YggE